MLDRNKSYMSVVHCVSHLHVIYPCIQRVSLFRLYTPRPDYTSIRLQFHRATTSLR